MRTALAVLAFTTVAVLVSPATGWAVAPAAVLLIAIGAGGVMSLRARRAQ